MVPDPTCGELPSGCKRATITAPWRSRPIFTTAMGKLLVTTGHKIFRLLTPADYNTLLAGGMAFHQEISVPVKGEYYLRTAIHDLVSGTGGRGGDSGRAGCETGAAAGASGGV